MEWVVAGTLQEIEKLALEFSPQERDEFIHRLIVSLEGTPKIRPTPCMGLGWENCTTLGGYGSGTDGMDSGRRGDDQTSRRNRQREVWCGSAMAGGA